MYYPYIYVTLLCILQFIIFIINFIARLCGKVLNILIGINFGINIVLLCLGYLGLNSRVPNASFTECIKVIL